MKNKAPKLDPELDQNSTSGLLNEDGHIETQIPESQGDLADRADNEIESDLQWRIEMIRRASREDYLKRMQNKE